MSDTEIFVDNSTDYNSAESVEHPEELISIEETDPEDEEDEETKQVIERIKKRQSRRMSFYPKRASSSSSSSSKSGSEKAWNASDDEGNTSDAEKFAESKALSPTTRMSITGIPPDDLDSDTDSEPVVMVRKTKKNVITSDDETDSEPDENIEAQPAPNEKRHFSERISIISNKVRSSEENLQKNENISLDESLSLHSAGEKTQDPNEHDSFDDSLPLRSFNAEGDRRDSICTKLSSTIVSEEKKNDFLESSDNGRLSRNIRMSIGTKLSSTMIDTPSDQLLAQEKENSVSIELISSSEDENQPKPLIQPTIKSELTKQIVSQSFYDSKMRDLSDKQTRLCSLEKLMKLDHMLPNNGDKIKKSIEITKREIKKLTKEIDHMAVHKEKGIRKEIQKSFDNSSEFNCPILVDSTNTSAASSSIEVTEVTPSHLSWEEVQKVTNDIKPVHTGKQGLQTFETQKTLTLDRLANLHKSLESCPTEDVLAEPPKLLKIELLNHQLHGLAWMLWRENQKPRGGILADDMGLGKTLSMIALILKSAELEDPDKEITDSESDKESSSAGWKSKGRRDFYAGGTLVVCPASLMNQWELEITNRVIRNSLAVNIYHGTNRDVKPRNLAKYDVVITTYNIVSRESKSSYGGIFGVNWERIILDEAHTIRNHKSIMSIASCNLKGRCRWALTGTPIQNKEMDMYALLKFLRCTPFDDLNHWKRWVDNKTSGGAVRLNTIVKTIMLRRTKAQLLQKGSLQSLPEKNVNSIEVRLDKDEMNVYQRVLLYSRTLFAQFLHQRVEKEHDMYMGTGPSRPTFAQKHQPNSAFDRVHQRLKQLHSKEEVKQHQILVLLLRLRQICCHPGLINQMLEDGDDSFDVSLAEKEYAELDLLDQLNKLKITDPLTNDSVGQRELNISDNLPENSDAISKASSKVMQRSNPVFDLDRISSKITKALELLEEKVLGGNDKAIIVSQWSSVLDIVAKHLCAKRVRHVCLTGKVPVKNRNEIVVNFNNQESVSKVMLLSLTAGGVGLNLIGANHLLLLDPHWNPQLELQAQDRIYRVGQKKPVFIWKFYCADTVEQAIKGIQEKKLGIANEVLTGTKHTGSKLTIDDLKLLFGL